MQTSCGISEPLHRQATVLMIFKLHENSNRLIRPAVTQSFLRHLLKHLDFAAKWEFTKSLGMGIMTPGATPANPTPQRGPLLAHTQGTLSLASLNLKALAPTLNTYTSSIMKFQAEFDKL